MEPLPGATRRAHEVAKRVSHWVGGDSGAKRALGWGAGWGVCVCGARRVACCSRGLASGGSSAC